MRHLEETGGDGGLSFGRRTASAGAAIFAEGATAGLETASAGAPPPLFAYDPYAGGLRITTGSDLRSTLEAILRTPPEAYGYGTYQGRFGWSVGKLLRCLLENHGIEISRSTLRRALSELNYDWKHKRWMPHRERFG